MPADASTARTAAAVTCTPGWHELVEHRDALVRYARRRLLDPALAEDLVHDVFEAVATGKAAFGGRSALRSWLVGILKHKIVDLVRQRAPQHALPDDPDEGPWALASDLPGPEEVAAQRQRLASVMRGLADLTPGLRDAVWLRLVEDRSTADVCAALAITEDNLFVRLHRARRALAA